MNVGQVSVLSTVGTKENLILIYCSEQQSLVIKSQYASVTSAVTLGKLPNFSMLHFF